jgi:hypothetical protein
VVADLDAEVVHAQAGRRGHGRGAGPDLDEHEVVVGVARAEPGGPEAGRRDDDCPAGDIAVEGQRAVEVGDVENDVA